MKMIANVFYQIQAQMDPSDMHIEQVVLDRIPRIDRIDYEFPQTAPIFLEGYNIMREPQSPKAFPIVLTSTEAGRRYGIALMFYEDLKDYIRVLQEALPTYIAAEKDQEDSKKISEDSKQDKFDEETEKMLKDEMDRRSRNTTEEYKFDASEGKLFRNISKLLMSYGEGYMNTDQLFNGNNYYIPKAIILISEYPIFETLEQIIRHIYIQWVKGIDYPLEAYLVYLTHCAPLPPVGTTLSYSFPNLETFSIENKLLNELPAVPTSFYWEFFTKQIINMNNFFDLLYWFMWQMGTTVFISTSVNKIVMCTEVLRTIIFPFEYDDTYIPCLPTALINYLEAPFPVLVGLVVTDEQQLTEVYEISSNKTMFVLLDDDELRVKLNESIITMKNLKKVVDVLDDGTKISYAQKELPLKNK